jgi:hypothetical protein
MFLGWFSIKKKKGVSSIIISHDKSQRKGKKVRNPQNK